MKRFATEPDRPTIPEVLIIAVRLGIVEESTDVDAAREFMKRMGVVLGVPDNKLTERLSDAIYAAKVTG